MAETFRTSEIAALIGVHPNTVRLYEELELIPKPERLPNGYRVFTDFHLQQLRLVRLAFEIEVLQNGLRKKMIRMVKTAAERDFDSAITLIREYLAQIDQERHGAEEAIRITRQILSGAGQSDAFLPSLRRREVSEALDISMDALRNWEMNGLLSVKRKANGYRIYTGEDLQRLKIIRALRCANYSLEAILRMLGELSQDPEADIRKALDTPSRDDTIISVCDKLISSLNAAHKNAVLIENMLTDMKQRF